MCYSTRSENVKPISHGLPNPEKEAVKDSADQDQNNQNHPETGDGTRVTGDERPVDGNYSIQFEIADKNGRLCAGMYYSIKLESESHVHNNLVTDANGMTTRFFTNNKGDKVYLYIGHREEKYGDLPTAREGKEHIYDEYVLNDQVADQTVAPNKKFKVAYIKTQRLWQPWMPSEEIKTLLKDIERYAANFYDLGDGGLTIGYGHFTRHGNKTELARLREKYPNGITREQADTLFEDDVRERAAYRTLYELIKVPMHQHEFDALICMRFNSTASTEGTRGFAVAAPHAQITGQTTIKDHLNKGQYTQAGNRIPTIYNSSEGKWHKGVQNRRNCETDIFLKGIYQRW